jgi:hypothetical protein
MAKFKQLKSKNLIPTMVLKFDKETNFIYPLSNGEVLEFPNKVFPVQNVILDRNQLKLF